MLFSLPHVRYFAYLTSESSTHNPRLFILFDSREPWIGFIAQRSGACEHSNMDEGAGLTSDHVLSSRKATCPSRRGCGRFSDVEQLSLLLSRADVGLQQHVFRVTGGRQDPIEIQPKLPWSSVRPRCIDEEADRDPMRRARVVGYSMTAFL